VTVLYLLYCLLSTSVSTVKLVTLKLQANQTPTHRYFTHSIPVRRFRQLIRGPKAFQCTIARCRPFGWVLTVGYWQRFGRTFLRNDDGVAQSVWRLGYRLDDPPVRGETSFGAGIDGLITMRNQVIVQSIQLYNSASKPLLYLGPFAKSDCFCVLHPHSHLNLG
jgi:hypothetical protein